MRGKKKRGRRTRGKRIPSRTILIVCEGESESIYLNALKKELELRTTSIKIEANAGNHSATVKRAIKLRDKRAKDATVSDTLTPYDEIWCVFDVENPQNHQDDLTKAIQLAGNQFQLAISNPCFEVWYLLHFSKGHYFRDGQHAKQALKKQIPNYNETTNLFPKLYPKTPVAMRNAVLRLRQRDTQFPNPSTYIHKLLCQAFFGNQPQNVVNNERCFFKIRDVPRCAYCKQQAIK